MQNMAISVLVVASLVFSLLFCTSQASTTPFSPSSSSSKNAVIATEQIKAWAQNVQNKMPQSILNKLSPLTKQDSQLFTTKMHSNTFKFDAKFCSLANLACGSALADIKLSGDKAFYNNDPQGHALDINLAASKAFYNNDPQGHQLDLEARAAKAGYNLDPPGPELDINLASKAFYNNDPQGQEHHINLASKAFYNNGPQGEEHELVISNPFMFFRLSTLKPGNLFHLPKQEQSLPNRAFLPLEVASKISLASSNDIIKLFGSSWNKNTKDVIKTTLSYCNANAVKGEIRSCPKSLEEVISFSKSVLGDQQHSKLLLRALTSESNNGWNKELLIKNVKKLSADKIVACHEMLLPFATYYCHKLPSVYLYNVDFVEPKSGAAVNKMLAICHMDTSGWSKKHVAFEMLKMGPGRGEACHWFSALDLAWIGTN